MQSMTLTQLRATAGAGGVVDVTLRGQGGGFFVEISTRSGQAAILSKARSSEPRRFGNPASALALLLGIGISVTRTDATDWNPDEKDMSQSRPRQSQALRHAHKAAAYSKWLGIEIQTSIEDPGPNIAHNDVMSVMDADIAALTSRTKART